MDLILTGNYAAIGGESYPAGKVAAGVMGYRRAGGGLLPPGLRMIGPRGDYWVFERPSRHLRGYYMERSFFVMAPWVVFIIEQASIKCFARPEPITRPEDMLYHLPLPGIKDDGTVRFKPNGKTIDRIMARTLQRFEEFNWDGAVSSPPEGWPEAPNQLLEHWASTISNTREACDVAWQPAETLAGVLDTIQWKADPERFFTENLT